MQMLHVGVLPKSWNQAFACRGSRAVRFSTNELIAYITHLCIWSTLITLINVAMIAKARNSTFLTVIDPTFVTKEGLAAIVTTDVATIITDTIACTISAKMLLTY